MCDTAVGILRDVALQAREFRAGVAEYRETLGVAESQRPRPRGSFPPVPGLQTPFPGPQTRARVRRDARGGHVPAPDGEVEDGLLIKVLGAGERARV